MEDEPQLAPSGHRRHRELHLALPSRPKIHSINLRIPSKRCAGRARAATAGVTVPRPAEACGRAAGLEVLEVVAVAGSVEDAAPARVLASPPKFQTPPTCAACACLHPLWRIASCIPLPASWSTPLADSTLSQLAAMCPNFVF